MDRPSRRANRRSYDQYCAAARALDAVGDRWTLLIARELLAGPRRYTDLHADLPGVSTDMLATRLRDMEGNGLALRRRLPAPASTWAYELTERGRQLHPVLAALAAWGAPDLGERRATDAVRAHWLALPLVRALEDQGVRGVVEVRTDEGDFHVCPGDTSGPVYGHGPAEPDGPNAVLTLDAATCAEICRGELSLRSAVLEGRVEVTGEGEVAATLAGVEAGAA